MLKEIPIRKKKYKWKSFEEAQNYTQSLGIETYREWTKYSKSGHKPEDIPSNPAQTYRDEFLGYGNWLGTGNIATQKVKFLPFKKAQKFVHSLQLKSTAEWRIYCKSGAKPSTIPTYPERIYKGDFSTMLMWLGENNSTNRRTLKDRRTVPRTLVKEIQEKKPYKYNYRDLDSKLSKILKKIISLEGKIFKIAKKLRVKKI